MAWFHLTNGFDWGLVRYSGYQGRLGVPVFFVISGFVIPYALHNAGYRLDGFWRFLARRMTRLEPSYLVSVLVSVLVGLALAKTFAPAQILGHLLYVIPLTRYDWVNGVYWTLAYEFVFYAAVGLLFPLLWRRNILWIVALGALVTWAIPVDHEFHALVLCFVIGIVSARRHFGVDPAWVSWGALALTVALMVAWGGKGPAIVGLATALVILFLRIPNLAPLSLLGTVSYPLYLLHIPIGCALVDVLRPAGRGTLFELGIALTGLVASIAAAAVLYVAVDRPAMALARRISPSRPAAAPEASRAQVSSA